MQVGAFRFGEIRLTVFEVGRFEMSVGDLFGAVPPGELAAACARHQITTDPVEFRMLPFIADLGDRRVVIDPGGHGDPTPMRAGLAEAGIAPESIDAVVITHGHLDHYGGCIAADGSPLFSRAKHFIQRAEWEHWIGDESGDAYQAENFRRFLEPMAEHFTLMEGDGEVVPGIEAIMTPGHSPGHMVVKVADVAVHTGDALLTSVCVEHPEWVARWEARGEQVVESRRRLLTLMADEDLLAMLSHMPFPGVGRARARADGWEWLREPLGAS